MRRSIPLFIIGALMLFIGIYMILCPSTFMAVTLSVFSVYMLFDGIRGIVSIFRFRNMSNGIRSAVLAKSIAAIGAGVTIIAISIARPDILIPVFVYIAGAVFLIAGIVNLADFIILSRSGIRFGYLGVEVVLLFLLAILLFLFPVFIGSSIITVFAALICSAGAVSVTCGVFSILMQRRIRTIIRKNEEILPGHYDE